jgi:hypothetical protein
MGLSNRPNYIYWPFQDRPLHLLNPNELILPKRLILTLSLAFTSLTLLKRLLATFLAPNTTTTMTSIAFDDLEEWATTTAVTAERVEVTLTGADDVATELVL